MLTPDLLDDKQIQVIFCYMYGILVLKLLQRNLSFSDHINCNLHINLNVYTVHTKAFVNIGYLMFKNREKTKHL